MRMTHNVYKHPNISSIPYSQLITKKRQYLINFNTLDNHLTTHGGATEAKLRASSQPHEVWSSFAMAGLSQSATLAMLLAL